MELCTTSTNDIWMTHTFSWIKREKTSKKYKTFVSSKLLKICCFPFNLAQLSLITRHVILHEKHTDDYFRQTYQRIAYCIKGYAACLSKLDKLTLLVEYSIIISLNRRKVYLFICDCVRLLLTKSANFPALRNND